MAAYLVVVRCPGNFKLVLIIAIALMAFCTAVLGIYLFFITKTKKANGHALVKARRNHRYTAIVGALFTLAWSFSGAYHAFAKFKTDDRDAFFISNQFAPNIDLDFARLQAAVYEGPVSNFSLVKMGDDTWWRVTCYQPPIRNSFSEALKSKEEPAPVLFVNTTDYSVLPQGEERYAIWLADQFSHNPANSFQSVTRVTKFNDEYNFTDKRLPVWKVSYALHNRERYFVETSTGKLSVRVDDSELAEGYSFALLHKHHFMDWAGKTARDWSTMVWALFLIVIIVIGLILWWRAKKPK